MQHHLTRVDERSIWQTSEEIDSSRYPLANWSYYLRHRYFGHHFTSFIIKWVQMSRHQTITSIVSKGMDVQCNTKYYRSESKYSAAITFYLLCCHVFYMVYFIGCRRCWHDQQLLPILKNVMFWTAADCVITETHCAAEWEDPWFWLSEGEAAVIFFQDRVVYDFKRIRIATALLGSFHPSISMCIFSEELVNSFMS